MKKCTAKCWTGPLVSGKPSLVADGNAGAILLVAVPGQIMSDADAATYDPTSFATFFAAATLVEGKIVNQPGSIRQYMEVSAA
jgi:hypothetical protein